MHVRRPHPVLPDLSGHFADGGTASGSFDYDAGTNAYSFVNITTSGGSLTGATYLALDPGFCCYRLTPRARAKC